MKDEVNICVGCMNYDDGYVCVWFDSYNDCITEEVYIKDLSGINNFAFDIKFPIYDFKTDVEKIYSKFIIKNIKKLRKKP